MYTKEEIVEKVNVIAENMDKKAAQAEQLKASVLVDRGRLEELKNLYNMIIEAEEAVKESSLDMRKTKPAAKSKAKK